MTGPMKPIFIIGAGRSGSTIFHQVFAKHPHVVWLSGVCNKYPAQPEVNRYFMQLIDFPWLGSLLQRRIMPGECYPFWEHHIKGFSAPFRDLTAIDATERSKERIQSILAKMTTRKRHRLLIKITGWSRLSFLQVIFPDAKFIHVVRDGRAVANSLLNVRFWRGWQGPYNWRWGPLTPELESEWCKHDMSFVALAALQWRILVDSVEQARVAVPTADFLQVKYEEFCASPIPILKKVVAFCDLEWEPSFEKAIGRYQLLSQNTKWQKALTLKQQEILQDVLVSHLTRYGYA